MNLQKNIEIDQENDVDEYVNLLLYPIKDTITQFLNKKMSIKQRNQLNIEKTNNQEIYSMGKLQGFQCLHCLIIFPKTSFSENNSINNMITVFSLLHLDQN